MTEKGNELVNEAVLNWMEDLGAKSYLSFSSNKIFLPNNFGDSITLILSSKVQSQEQDAAYLA